MEEKYNEWNQVWPQEWTDNLMFHALGERDFEDELFPVHQVLNWEGVKCILH
jgi:hypothetical protein